MRKILDISLDGLSVTKSQITKESSESVNKNKFTSSPSVDTTSILSLLNAAYSLLDKKIKTHPVFKPRTLLVVFTILSVGVPLSTWPTRIVGRFPFWIFWLMVFYGTIWSFGYFNRSYVERISQKR